jgi:hypothetical protein
MFQTRGHVCFRSPGPSVLETCGPTIHVAQPSGRALNAAVSDLAPADLYTRCAYT